MSIKQSHSFSLGIVGLPNVGKSTIFNALTKRSVPADNFPFCTIDKNVGVVEIPDERLEKMATHFQTEKMIPSVMNFVDIAGLVKGASEGAGLGNQFLSHIREVDVIIYILRAFESEQILHVYNRVNPLSDFEVVQSELILKDIDSVTKRLINTEKTKKGGDRDAKKEYELLTKILEELNNGTAVIDMHLSNEEQDLIHDLWLLTNKRRLFLLNVRADIDMERVKEWKKEIEGITGDSVLVVDIKMLADISEMNNTEVENYISLLDEKPCTVEDIIREAFTTLNLISFYTGSKKECNAWSIVKGTTAKEAAGVIHSDLEQGFVAVEVVNLEEMLKVGGWLNAREKGLIKNHGKEYEIGDGDYIVILSNK